MQLAQLVKVEIVSAEDLSRSVSAWKIDSHESASWKDEAAVVECPVSKEKRTNLAKTWRRFVPARIYAVAALPSAFGLGNP